VASNTSEHDGDPTPSARAVGLDSLPDLFHAVLDRSGTGVMVFDADLRIAYVNDVAARVGGYPVEAHLGRRLGDLHPQAATQAEPALRRVLEEGEPVLNQETVWESPAPPHQRWYWLVSYVPLTGRDGDPYAAAIYVETTEVRRAHERLATLIDALPTFVGLCTPEGIITEANEATVAAAGVVREALVGRPLWEAPWWRDLPEARRRVHDAVMVAQEGRASRFDVEARVGDADPIVLDFQLVPIVERGVVTALLPSGLDITARMADQARLQALATLSHELNGAVTIEQATRLVVVHAPAVIGATVASVALVDWDERIMRIDHGLPPDIAERWTVLHLGGNRTVWHDAIESGRTLVVDRATRSDRYPQAVADARLAGIDTTAAVPLTDEDGRTFGAIGIGWAAPLADVRLVRTRLQLLSDLCSAALRRAQRTDVEHRFVRELQEEVLATPDGPAGLEVATAYEPAQADIGIGGDWFDVVALDDGSTAFVVGDVVGHGLAAAARMTEAKATIRSMVLTAERPDVIPATGRSLAHLDSGYVATAAVAWIDSAAGEVQWITAGHLPPVLRTPDGGTRLLPGPDHPPIGTSADPRPLASEPFPPGSLLVLCTDGLVERRDESIDAGMERLRALVESLPDGASAEAAKDLLLAGLRAGPATTTSRSWWCGTARSATAATRRGRCPAAGRARTGSHR